MLTCTPSWRLLPADVRGHLIRHPSLPADGGHARERLLPDHDGPRGDLVLNREAPPEFSIGG